MPKKIIGVYAGSFDPPTVGHEYAIRYCARIATKLIVAVGVNPDKKSTFSVQERLNMLRDMTSDLANVEVTQFVGEYLVDYTDSVEANVIFRGLRNAEDFEYENRMFHFNEDRAPHIQTWLMASPPEMMDVSSSFVKGLVGPKGWEDAVKRFLPPAVYKRFVAKSTELLANKIIEQSKDLPTIVADMLPDIIEKSMPRIVKYLLPRLPSFLAGMRRNKKKR